MTTNELIGFGILAMPVLTAAGAAIGAALIRSWMPAHDLAVHSADYVEAVKDAVNLAEKYGLTNSLPGVDKFAVAVREMDRWLDGQGIHGDAKLLTLTRVKQDIELMRLQLFPKQPKAPS